MGTDGEHCCVSVPGIIPTNMATHQKGEPQQRPTRRARSGKANPGLDGRDASLAKNRLLRIRTQNLLPDRGGVLIKKRPLSIVV